MATQLQLAAFALNSYGPEGANEILINGWNELTTLSRTSSSGFGASVFQGPDGEIVIAFRGTDTEPLFNIDWATGNTAALGIYSVQVREAIETVSDVMAAHPGATIRLTGHSLGGGLASLMATFFDLNATVFAPAPFELTARSESLQDLWPGPGVLPAVLPSDLVARYYADYRTYQTQRGRSLDTDFQTYGETFSSGSLQDREELFAQRELRVSGQYIDGEILEAIRYGWSSVGTLGEIDVGPTTLGNNSIALHSMSLHAALIADSTLAQASRQSPALLELLSDQTLYANDIQSDRVNFLNRLLNDHLSGDGSSLLQSFSLDMEMRMSA